MTLILNLSVFLFLRDSVFLYCKNDHLRNETFSFCFLLVYLKGKNTMNKSVG